MSAKQNLSYREPAREPPRRMGYGPLPPDPIAIVLTLALTLLAVANFASAVSRSEVECIRDRAEDEPTCVRTTWLLHDPEHERSAPALLRREGISAGLPMDVLEYDGITLMLPNNPPGPLTDFLDDPTDHYVLLIEDAALHGGFFALLFATLAAFVLPRALHVLARRSITIDRAAGTVRVGDTEVSIEDIASVRVQTCGDDVLSKVRGARVVLRMKNVTEVPLARYVRPGLARQSRFATELAKALGTKVEVVPTPGVPSSPPILSAWLVPQFVAAIATAWALITWLR